ncbi:MAG: Glutamyl-tRNA(Gln) amidotransferase subunit C [Microgenomates group bacterium ADurb.Bin219]|nr:MAG: Glutamyl-tRNA(Gln) amidotransferase subunit C [Microgenomates group bacterium ADurb.Bin219]HNP89364.1 Asp-tRNA(Asn)/Glu-tRNA(Gln) amidotransferase subunit GatC [Candidatus Woesebacteria bacterium]
MNDKNKQKLKNIKTLSEEEVKHIAKLANLSLSNEEVKKFQGQLSETLNFIQVLDELNTEKAEPTNHASGLSNIFRQDEIKPSISQAEALANAPSLSDGFFKVKAILERNDDEI